MQLYAILLSLLAAATCQAAAIAGQENRICGTPPPSEDYLQAIRDSKAQEAAAVQVERDIKVYVHIVAADTSRAGGNINDDTVTAQIKVLNDDFAGSGYQFTLQNISRTFHGFWSEVKPQDDLFILQQRLRRGTYADLNLYFFRRVLNLDRSPLAGFCRYPTVVSHPSGVYVDGCAVHVETTPGGAFAPWNLGHVTTHEVGHWLGLIHPWGNDLAGGGCVNGNDLVDDTPPQDRPVYGCNEQSRTCPASPFNDPVHNYMGYSDDSCVNQFTAGQYARMHSQFDMYRSGR